MPTDRDALRDWHRLFGLLLTDFFTGQPQSRTAQTSPKEVPEG